MWVLFGIVILVGGGVKGGVMGEPHADREACMQAAREWNALENPGNVKWANAGCIQIPNPSEPKPAKWIDI